MQHFQQDNDSLWFKNAIIYEVPVWAFADSNGDGIGDLRGATEKLDYLQDLGVTAVWLLPFFPSPLRDDGYDIADYIAVNPIYGTLEDFKQFLAAAHQRGIRVIIELIINHTSDQHPWFQRARRAAPGSVERDFYVWSETPEKYQEARIIFQDFETSNWAWDPIARAYYWHRFYSHQPDLNYDNPAVRQAVFEVLDFWLSMGVDGLRMDAVPYLYERQGTNCENLPETHAFLKQMRRYVDERYPNRMLLAEANQWPEDAAAYYGAGDECHMNFHFPLMPRLFMALRMEDSFPIVDILQQTPAIPDNCQWGLFLRNHDELTLEMVTDEDRDYMYRVYAQDAQMRVNLGIRPRLAPLLGNDRRQIELLTSLLLSLPGTPVLYYGDEIGMGDNVYLGDRNGVRTPMQWSSDRNAGFSAASSQRLYLPVITESEYHYAAINVETQQANPNSLWYTIKRLLVTRKRFQALGKGSFEFLHPENRKVLAFTRTYDGEHLLIVANLSRFVQTVELDLSPFKGFVPVEISGRTEFPPVSDTGYFLSLSPYAFYWFSLKPQPDLVQLPRLRSQLSALVVPQQWQQVWSQRLLKETLESILPDYFYNCSWFRGSNRTIQATHITETIPIIYKDMEAKLTWIQVNYIQGTAETYLLLLAYAQDEQAIQLLSEMPQPIIARIQVEQQHTTGVLFDAIADKTVLTELLTAIASDRIYKGGMGELVAVSTDLLKISSYASILSQLEPTPFKGEYTNMLVIYSDGVSTGNTQQKYLSLKLFRKLEPGINPDLEVRWFLSKHTQFDHITAIAGWLEYRPISTAYASATEPITLGVLQEFIPDACTTWDYTLDRLRDYFEHVTTQHLTLPPSEHTPSPHPLAQQLIGSYLANVQLLGQRTAELHLALASDSSNPDFAPEPFTSF
jgi:maltose alpha-D-glucosyltransferase/alpha-amylase